MVLFQLGMFCQQWIGRHRLWTALHGAYTNLHWLCPPQTHRPTDAADRHGVPGQIDELVPGLAAVIDDDDDGRHRSLMALPK